MDLLSLINKRNCLLGITVLYVAMAVWIATVPYEPMEWDLADATTNVIWTDLYSRGIYEIPVEEWDYGMTQSVVVEHDGEFVVVNEKGPGFVWMLVPFHILGLEFLFGPLMAGIAVFSTYMLGMRLFGWRVGFLASFIVLVNLSVIAMWHRYYWTDAATMHLLVLSLWLFMEANFRYNGGHLYPGEKKEITRRTALTASCIAFLSGLAFAASISTRYPVALTMAAPVIFMLLSYLIHAWPHLRKGRIREAIVSGRSLALMLFFFLGLMCILVPLMQYNAEYFGGPFKSGYDAATLMEFNETAGAIPRDQSGNWFDSAGDRIGTVLHNTVVLIPILILRMPALLLAPLGIWSLWNRKLVLLFLLAWIFIAFYTYISLDFVDRYSNPRIYFDVVWEPRYFMPALPAVALLGALGIERIAFNYGPGYIAPLLVRKKQVRGGQERSQCSVNKLTSTVLVLILLLIIALPGFLPAIQHFKDPSASPPHHPKPPDAIKVTTDQLILDPGRYVQRFVLVTMAEVVGIIPGGWAVRSIGARMPGNVTVRLSQWPPGQIPQFDIGDEIVIQGLFVKARQPDALHPFFINVKWDTRDFIGAAEP